MAEQGGNMFEGMFGGDDEGFTGGDGHELISFPTWLVLLFAIVLVVLLIMIFILMSRDGCTLFGKSRLMGRNPTQSAQNQVREFMAEKKRVGYNNDGVNYALDVWKTGSARLPVYCSSANIPADEDIWRKKYAVEESKDDIIPKDIEYSQGDLAAIYNGGQTVATDAFSRLAATKTLPVSSVRILPASSGRADAFSDAKLTNVMHGISNTI